MMSDPLTRLNQALAGRYRVERELGEGGMATVYLADDLKHGRKVALKVLKPELAEGLGPERFLAEIRTTANLRHPNILPLFDSGESEGFLFYVMPYAEGESLQARLDRDGRLPIDDALRIAVTIAEAIDYAHRHGVVHRDIKPGNVLLLDDKPVVSDFGIALAADVAAGPRLTRTGIAVGSPGYMSPEQAAGEQTITEASDIYSLGALLYEMLAGGSPYGDATPLSALSKALTEPPPDVRAARPEVPDTVASAVARAMAPDPEARFGSAAEFARELAIPSGSATGGSGPVGRRLPYLIAALALVAVAVGGLQLRSALEARRITTEVVPEAQRLIRAGESAQAFALLGPAVAALPDDPLLMELNEAATTTITITSSPAGARVSFRPYDPEDTVWTFLGETPLEGVSVPDEELLIRYELEGYRPFEASVEFFPTKHAELQPQGGPEVMLRIPTGTYSMRGDPVPVDSFWVDEYEVSNADYQRFVDDGGYAERAAWSGLFDSLGVEFDAARMEAEFVDRTGRPAPPGWELARHASGAERLPVQGVSWFEAARYCAWAGKSLPTYYHWKQADGGSTVAWDGVMAHANLEGGEEVAPVGASQSRSPHGVADMAGNVREWVWNASGADRYILGGSWSSAAYMYSDYDATDPWSRISENGFRCARFPDELDPALHDPIENPVFDFRGFEPVDDATFEVFADQYRYDAGPLNVEREVVSETDDYTRELVEIDAAYLDERLPIHVFLPKHGEPPYQTVVYFPGVSAFLMGSSPHVGEIERLMFVPLSGRALLYPVLRGTYERRDERPSRGPAERRQRMVWIVQDVMRTVDYVEERPELDEGALSYLGLSYGAELAVPVALEKRFDTAVLVGAALDPAWVGAASPEYAPWNFVSRITVPTIVINGRYDFMHPYDQGQVPFFEMIDVPDEDKEFVVLEAGHLPHNNDVIRHTLDWLDARLGPVQR